MKDHVRNEEVVRMRTAMEQAGLYIVPRERLRELAAVAADAYRDYPLHNWFCGGRYKGDDVRVILQASMAAMFSQAVICADSEALNAFAVWAPPGFRGSRTVPFLQHGGVQLVLWHGPGIARRLISYESFAMSFKQKYTAHEDWYLYNLSTRHDMQGKGLASRLLHPMLDILDRTGRISYLETNKASNVPLYEHFGYTLAEQATVPHSDVTHYAMVRKPQSREA